MERRQLENSSQTTRNYKYGTWTCITSKRMYRRQELKVGAIIAGTVDEEPNPLHEEANRSEDIRTEPNRSRTLDEEVN